MEKIDQTDAIIKENRYIIFDTESKVITLEDEIILKDTRINELECENEDKEEVINRLECVYRAKCKPLLLAMRKASL